MLMGAIRVLMLTLLLLVFLQSNAQTDSSFEAIQNLPVKYLSNIDKKIDKYSDRITGKTEKTLAKLSKWENKIKGILDKVSPEASQKLFGNNQTTFSTLLKRIQEGKAVAEGYKAKYDDYRDKLTTSIKYLEQQKDKLNTGLIEPIKRTQKGLAALEENVENTEEVERFIKERKNQLIDEAVKYMGKSKYLNKINKEAYYYVETLRNYKEIFSDKKKTEEVVLKLLEKIPAFKSFMQNNSALAGLFTSPASFAGLGGNGSIPIVNGLANRASLQQYLAMNTSFSAAINPMQQLNRQLSDANSPVGEWKDKLNKLGGMGNKNLRDFTPNTQRSKTFRQRLEYGTDLQFGKSLNYLPATSDIAIKVGYKLNDKSSAGIGVNYKLGIGNGWDNIRISSQGIGFRTYLKWKFKKVFDVQGGSEWNYMLQFNKISQLKNANAWQQSALIGLSKNYTVSKKLKGSIQILYDFLYSKHSPQTQPLVFRFGYGF